MAGDLFDEGAQLITEVGRCYERGRRYRAIAAECEDRVLARALAIGGEMRVWARDPVPDEAACAAAVEELTELLRACAAAIDSVHAGAPYRRALRAWNVGDWRAVAALAPTIFDAVEPLATTRPLHFGVAVTGRRGSEHFLPAAAVAEQVLELMRSGLPAADPVPELGADDRLRAVVLEQDAEAVEAPVTIVVAPEDVPWPLFRLAPAGEVLVYARHVLVPMRVRCAARTADEWWAVRPDAYESYVAELAGELATRGVTAIERS